jgi:hypothetical protein
MPVPGQEAILEAKSDCGSSPVMLIFHQPFGFNAILGLIGLSGILMWNTLILIGRIRFDNAGSIRDDFNMSTVQVELPEVC